MSLPKALQNIDSIETNINNIEDGTTTVGSATTASSCTGNSATATTLATARTIQTNLASSSSASFDGSANITPGVTGVLPVANGGTGSSTEKYLPLSGGSVMTGAILTSYSDVSIRQVDGFGALYLLPNTRSGYEGIFILQTGTTSTVSINNRLEGFPSGNLKWNNCEIERVNSSGTNYIRFASGLQICFQASTVTPAQAVVDITYPVAFSSSPAVSVFAVHNSSDGSYYIKLAMANTTSFRFVKYLTETGTTVTDQFNYSYIAIGKWS